MTTTENVRELLRRKQTLVRIENVIKFMTLCAAIGIVCNGGALESEHREIVGQWFYI